MTVDLFYSIQDYNDAMDERLGIGCGYTSNDHPMADPDMWDEPARCDFCGEYIYGNDADNGHCGAPACVAQVALEALICPTCSGSKLATAEYCNTCIRERQHRALWAPLAAGELDDLPF